MRHILANACGISLLVVIATTVVSQEPNRPTRMLELVPKDAGIGVVYHSVDRLKKRLARLQNEEDLSPKSLQTIGLVVSFLDAKPTLDQRQPLAVVAFPTSETVNLGDLVILLPQKPGANANAQLIAPLALNNRQIAKRGNYRLFSLSETLDLDKLSIGKNSLQQIVSRPLAKQLNDADMMLFVSADLDVKRRNQQLDNYSEVARSWKERRLRALGMRFIEDLSNVRLGVATTDIREGLTVNTSAIFRNPDESPPFVFDRLFSSPSEHPPHYRGLPQKPLLAAIAFGDAATHNAETLTVMNRLEMIDLKQLEPVLRSKWNPNTVGRLIEFLAPLASKTDGARGAVYGDHTTALMIDTQSPDQVVAALQGLIADETLAPLLEYVPDSESVRGVSVDTIRLRKARPLTDPNQQPRTNAILAVVAHGIRIAKLDKHVVISAEEEPTLMKEMIDNLEHGDPGLANDLAVPKRVEGQIQVLDICFPAHQLIKLMLPNVKPANNKQRLYKGGDLTRVSLDATRRDVSIRIEVPRKDFVEALKNGATWWLN